jgi:uncharacterized protein
MPAREPAIAADFPKAVGHVNDFANVLEEPIELRLEAFLREVAQRYDVEVAILTMANLDGEDPTEYANQIFEDWGIGGKDSDRGLLLLDAKQERFVRAEVGYGLEGVLPDGKVGSILDREVIPYLKQGRPDVAYVAGVRGLLLPVLEEAGESAQDLDALLQGAGYTYRPPPKQRGHGSPGFSLR